jgi:hypothetical protein
MATGRRPIPRGTVDSLAPPVRGWASLPHRGTRRRRVRVRRARGQGTGGPATRRRTGWVRRVRGAVGARDAWWRVGRMWWAQSHRLVSTGTHGLPPGRTLGEGFEEAAGLGDGGAAAGGLGQEGGEGRGEGTGELGRAGPFAEDGRGGGLPPLLSGPPPRAAERSLTLDGKEQDGPQGTRGRLGGRRCRL